MRQSLSAALESARRHRAAVAAFNVYTLDQAAGILDAALDRRVPVILQVLPSGLADQLVPLLASLRAAADLAPIPVMVHLDHCTDLDTISLALANGADSVMADGSELPFSENIRFTQRAIAAAMAAGGEVEAELGRLTGSEDGMGVEERQSKLTDPAEARLLAETTKVASLAVCVGNVHGLSARPPELDLDLLAQIADQCPVPLVLHGASGLPPRVLQAAIQRGVAKVNVNTEIRAAYRNALRDESAHGSDVTDILLAARQATSEAAGLLIDRIGSAGLADRE